MMGFRGTGGMGNHAALSLSTRVMQAHAGAKTVGSFPAWKLPGLRHPVPIDRLIRS